MSPEKRTHYWVLRDLSNGDGADGRTRPTYVWAFPTREQARSAARLHKAKDFARLGPVEYWPAENLAKDYMPGDPGTVSEHYYVRRSR